MIRTDMVEYWAERCHSPSKKKRKLADNPTDDSSIPDSPSLSPNKKKRKLLENYDYENEPIASNSNADGLPSPKICSKNLETAEYEFLIVYTDGACTGNGKANPIAGVGAYFGPNDPRNISELLPGEKQTNQRAELMVRNISII